jgi:hypothetical protein
MLCRVATVRHEGTDLHYEVIEFKRVGGAIMRRQYRRELIGSPRDLERALLRDGADLPASRQERQELIGRLLAQEAPATGILVGATGWRPDHNAFVLPDRVLCADGEPPATLFLDQDWRGIAPLEVAGTLAGWQKEIAGPARHSSRLMCSICAGLAAPLLPFADHPTFALNLFGRSCCGKTTGLRVVRTLLGVAPPGALLTANMTRAALEQEAAKCNHLPLLIDELTASETEGGASSLAAGPIAYVLAGGAGRRRHSSYADKTGGGALKWLTVAQVTNEHPLAREAEDARRRRRDGELVRFIDLPAASGSNETVVDRFPEGLGPERRKAFARRLVAGLNPACERHAGHALPAFILWLIPRHEELPARVKGLMRSFLDEVGAASDSVLGARLARVFAVIYAAGVLGVEAGILPWSPDEVLWAVRRCFEAARALVRDDALLAREGLRRFWKELKGSGETWPAKGEEPDPAVARAEVFRKRRRTCIEYAVVPEVVERWLSDPQQRRLVLGALRRDGRLRTDGKNLTRQPRVLGPGDRRRYYVVQRPLETVGTGQRVGKGLKKAGGPKRRSS